MSVRGSSGHLRLTLRIVTRPPSDLNRLRQRGAIQLAGTNRKLTVVGKPAGEVETVPSTMVERTSSRKGAVLVKPSSSTRSSRLEGEYL